MLRGAPHPAGGRTETSFLGGVMEGEWTLAGSLWGDDVLNRKKARETGLRLHGGRVTGPAGRALFAYFDLKVIRELLKGFTFP